MAGLDSLSRGLPPQSHPASVPSAQVVPHLHAPATVAKGKAPRQQMNLRLQQQLQTTDSCKPLPLFPLYAKRPHPARLPRSIADH